jgi:hypothetical protein
LTSKGSSCNKGFRPSPVSTKTGQAQTVSVNDDDARSIGRSSTALKLREYSRETSIFHVDLNPGALVSSTSWHADRLGEVHLEPGGERALAILDGGVAAQRDRGGQAALGAGQRSAGQADRARGVDDGDLDGVAARAEHDRGDDPALRPPGHGATNGNKTHAARVLGIDRRSLYRRLEAPRPEPEPSEKPAAPTPT